MKLQKYTPKQTKDLIDMFYTVAGNQRELNQFIVCRIDTIYDEYCLHFKRTWYRWSPVSKKDFVSKFNAFNGGSYITNINFDETDELGLDWYKTDTMRWAKIPFYFNTHHLDKHSDYTFTGLEREVLSYIGGMNDMFSERSKFANAFKIATRYAKKPFEIEEDDVVWIEQLTKLRDDSQRLMDKINAL